MYKYSLILKTGDAELRAVEHVQSDSWRHILPLIEITRGRKITRDSVAFFPFENKLSKLRTIFNQRTVAVDLTSDSNLSSPEIDRLYDFTDGYHNWVDFLLKMKGDGGFGEIIPTILINADDPDFDSNLRLQVRALIHDFPVLMYRNSILDENCYDDIEILKTELSEQQLYIMVDCGYTPQSSHKNFSEKAIARLRNLQSQVEGTLHVEYILSATSFPQNVSQFGDVSTDTFSISEIAIYEDVKRFFPDVIYGDYGSINPVRNDAVIMAHGWIPRIDVALSRSIYYYKQRRPQGVTAYASTYQQVAKQAIADSRFPSEMDDNWGIQQIKKCANEEKSSSAPRFWISVRMNIHIEQQIKRLIQC